MSLISHLECLQCLRTYNPKTLQTYCHHDDQPLVAKYHLQNGLNKNVLAGRNFDMWRYEELLPLFNTKNKVSLGEGFTPILRLEDLGRKYQQKKLLLKNESLNPTGSFKARGLSMAVSKAKELGVKKIAIPTAGNAGSALSAYAAKAKIDAFIYMPKNTPLVFQLDNEIMGARVYKSNGSIADAAQMMQDDYQDDWFDVSTLKEPYRLEGKKTMGLEIAEQLGWKLPDVIIYPTGGGTGLIGIYKAFKELLELNWIKGPITTKMVAVQNEVCAPIVQAFEAGLDYAPKISSPGITIANGLRVPSAFGDRLVMDTIYKSHGTALTVSDPEILECIKEFATSEGIFLSPEGAATFAGYSKLVRSKFIKPDDQVLLINTGSPYKYIENLN